jgi:hypothetical protein
LFQGAEIAKNATISALDVAAGSRRAAKLHV